MAKFTVHTNIGYVGAEHHDEFEIDDQDLAGLDRAGVESLAYEYAQEIAIAHLDYYITVGAHDGSKGQSLDKFKLIPAPNSIPADGEETGEK